MFEDDIYLNMQPVISIGILASEFEIECYVNHTIYLYLSR